MRKYIFGISVLLLVSIFCVWGYLTLIEEKKQIASSVKKSKDTLGVLEEERQKVAQELKQEQELETSLRKKLDSLKALLAASERKRSKLELSFASLRQEEGALETQIVQNKSMNFSLLQDRDTLAVKIAEQLRENNEFKMRSGSVEELKIAIRDARSAKKIQGSAPSQQATSLAQGEIK